MLRYTNIVFESDDIYYAIKRLTEFYIMLKTERKQNIS